MEIKITKKEGKLIDKIFEIGILVKALFGFFEVLGGIVFAVSGKLIINNIIIALTQQEIAEDPNDIITNYLIRAVNDFSTGSYLFAVIYLIFHGIVNLCLAIALLKNKIWVYPWAMAGFGLFIIYQVYRYLHTYSFLLLLLTLFDIAIVIIIWLEYIRKSKKVKIYNK